MGTNTSALLPADQVELICDETGRIRMYWIRIEMELFRLGFTRKQLQRLYVRFQELEKRETRTGYLTREDLLSIREVSANPLGQRLVDVIIEDHGNILTIALLTEDLP